MQIDYEQFGRATDQWAKRWLYLSNPSSINRCESNAKKKKKRTIVVIQMSHKILFLI